MQFFPRTQFPGLIGVAIVLITAWFSVGYHHPDEHYQILEFAKYKLGESRASDLPWEFREQMRPGLQPFIAYCVIQASRFVGISDPFTQAILLRMLAGLLALWVYWRWSYAEPQFFRDSGYLLRLCLVFFWMFPYLDVRFTSENLSGISFFAGLLLIYPAPERQAPWRLMAGGFLLCLSFFFRYQIAFAAVGLGLWLLMEEKVSRRTWFYLIAGALLAFIPGLATDRWLYGEWVFAPYKYFEQNILEDKAAGFGVSPWWAYLIDLPVTLLPPMSLLLIVFLIVGIGKRPRHVFVWCLLPFLLFHSVIEHKETRFLFPMIFPIFYLAVYGWLEYRHGRTLSPWARIGLKFVLIINVLALAYRSVYPANDLFVYPRFMRAYSAEHPEAVIYEERPQAGTGQRLEPLFYQSPWMKISYVDKFEDLNQPGFDHPKQGDLLFLKTLSPEFNPAGYSIERVYQWFPDWLLKFNINHWEDRTRIWSVYRVK